MREIRSFFKKQEIVLIRLLEKKPQSYTPVTFHKLRIEIKKLKAFFKLLEYCSVDFKRTKYFKPFKRIFLLAGNVREIQIEETLLKKYFADNLLNNYRDQLKKRQVSAETNFFLVKNDKYTAKLKKTYRQIIALLCKFDDKKVQLYLKNRKNKIQNLLSQVELESLKAHVLRKQLKEFYYLRNNLKLADKNKTNQKKDALPELLGKWHDCQIIIIHLENEINHFENNLKEHIQLKKITLKFQSQSEQLYKKIIKAIPLSEFYPSA